ncbi:hypothetical protein N1851_030246 [Merluccius polli]|uniref:SGNH hydrolase-type esterase domain-containing protein n=1 Tax=Merluccius polli TaxID=89951 RepID=A0AA47M5Y2_MERPO|nr:hypothetical protein N1851_030246 [Merluccius polli]
MTALRCSWDAAETFRSGPVEMLSLIRVAAISSGDRGARPRQKVEQLALWCGQNNLELSMLKTVEMTVDFRRSPPILPPPPPYSTALCLLWKSTPAAKQRPMHSGAACLHLQRFLQPLLQPQEISSWQDFDACGNVLQVPVIIKALPVPLEDPWPSLGARPKKLRCSTPFAPEPWITARGNKHWRRHSSGASTTTSQGQRRQSLPLAPVEVLHLSNKFHALEELPTSQPTQPAPPAGFPDAFPEAAVVGPGTAPAPVSTVPVSVAPTGSSPSPYTTRSRHPQPDHPPPSTIVLGISIVRHIRVNGGHTYCFPGACVSDILEQLPTALQQHPECTRLIVHVGSNDTRKREYTPDHRLLSLHNWLKAECTTLGIHFIDKFNLFWNRSDYYNRDGLHPNRTGAHFLSANMDFSILHTVIDD